MKRVNVTLTNEDYRILVEEFMNKGRLGNSVAAVVREIVTIYLTERGYHR